MAAIHRLGLLLALEEIHLCAIKMYGFNLELTQLDGSRFNAWFLLLTLVYSTLAFTGICVTEAERKYLVRTERTKRSERRYSISCRNLPNIPEECPDERKSILVN
jgi:hypothetical protein